MSETTINQPVKMISVKELFKKSLAVYPIVFWKVIKILLSPLIVLAPLVVVIGLAVLVNYALPAGPIAMTLYIILAILGVVALILFIVVMYIAQIAAMIVVQKNDGQIGVKQAFLLAKSQALKFLTTSLWACLFVFLWMLLFIIPGLVMAIYYTFISWMVLEEGLSNRAALKRSKDLVKDYWWAVFWRSVIPTIIIGIFFGILSSILVEPVNPDMPEQYREGQGTYNFITQIISFILTPFFVAYSYNMYKSLKAIKDKKV